MTENIVEFKNVSFTYNESTTPAVDDLSFSIKKGEWFTILGHNGSGKSTVTRLINGLLIPDDNGSIIKVNGDMMNEENVWKIRENVGIVFQNPENQFVGATVGDDVAFGLENRAVPRQKMIKIVNSMLKNVGMLEYIDTEPSNLSGGQKQRVAIAGILAVEPKILILDESTSMLDPRGRIEILSLVKRIKEENNLTVISITHNVEEIEHSDRVLLLDHGQKIILDKPSRIFRDKRIVDKYNLEMPLFYQLHHQLQDAGIEVPENIDSEEKLVNYLCQLNLTM